LLTAVAALTAASLALAGCGSSSGDSSDHSSGGGSATANVRVLLNAQPATLDPIPGARSAEVVWGTILEPLINTDQNLDPTDTGLITKWVRTTPTTWTFTLRPDVTFSDGEKADAASVVNTILLTRDSDTSVLKSYFGNVTDVTASDPTTIVLKTKTPQYNIPNLLTTVFLLPPDYYKQKGSDGFSAAPVGTGPYTFASSTPGQNIVVKRNPDYWGQAPSNEQITFTWSTDESQRLALLQSGAVDVALDLPPAQADQAKSAGLNVYSSQSAVKITGFLESTKPPFDDPNLRKAAALAVDRDAIVQGIFDGHAYPDAGLLNVKPGSKPTSSVTADPAEAKQLVGSSSPEVPITYPAGQYTNIEEVAQAIGGDLQKAGFKVKYLPVDYGTEVKQVVGRQLNGLYLLAAVPNVAVPDFFASGFMKSVSITGNCPDPQIDSLVSKALEQKDAAASQPIYDQLNDIGVVQKNCYIPLYDEQYTYATGKDVQGVVYSPLNAWDFTKTTIG